VQPVTVHLAFYLQAIVFVAVAIMMQDPIFIANVIMETYTSLQLEMPNMPFFKGNMHVMQFCKF
jgi:hypothetical protein